MSTVLPMEGAVRLLKGLSSSLWCIGLGMVQEEEGEGHCRKERSGNWDSCGSHTQVNYCQDSTTPTQKPSKFPH